MDYEHKRRAILTGLSPFFEGEALTSVVKLWEKEYAFNPHDGYSEFLSQIAKTKALRQQRMKMLGSIFVALEQPKEALMHVDFAPIPKSTVANKRGLVFERFLSHLLSSVAENDDQTLKSAMVQTILGLDLDAFQLDALGQFLDKESHDLMVEFDLITMREIVELIEQCMKNALGKDQTTHIFRQVIDKTMPISQAYDFDLTHIYQLYKK